MIKYADSDYSISNGGYLIDCSSKGLTNLICVFISNNPTSTATISTTYDILRISGFNSDFSAGS
jgi:hypothetical protein